MPSPITYLQEIKHIVVVMLENRSFDHMLGFLYRDANNVSPLGHSFEGLTGKETNPDDNGNQVPVFAIPTDKHPYFWPGTDPGEGYYNTNSQLFGNHNTPPAGTPATNQGFVTDFAYTLKWQRKANAKKAGSWHILEGTTANNIMGMYTPEMLPILSGLARGYAVCDHWFCPVPTETMPNRAFAHMATSQGRLNDHDKVYTAPTIFNRLAEAGHSWAIYGYTTPTLTLKSLQAIPAKRPHGKTGGFKDFQSAVADGSLANYTFLAPEWGPKGNSQHPNYDVAKGEQFLSQIYNTLHGSPVWDDTLLIITYDEHGGCYDHVAPPENATQPADCPDCEGFNFQRFGVRVPTVLVSPRIEAGTVFRVPEPDTDLKGQTAQAPTPFDHTSILATIEERFGLKPLTARDAAAPHVGGVLTLEKPRTDDPLKGVEPPVSGVPPTDEPTGKFRNAPGHLQEVSAELAARHPTKDDAGHTYYHSRYDEKPSFDTADEAAQYIKRHYDSYYR